MATETEPPDALTPAFAADADKRPQWRAFIVDPELGPGDQVLVVLDLAAFLMPHARTAQALIRNTS